MARVDELERDREAKDACIRDMEQLNSKRQEGLLATIEVLQEEVQNLTNRLGEFEKDRSTGPCVCDEQKERKALDNPEPPTPEAVAPIPPPDVTPASPSAKVNDLSLDGEIRKEHYLKKEERSRKKLCKITSCSVTSEAGELQGSCLTSRTAIDVQTMFGRTLCSSWLTNISWVFFSKTIL